jgi:hypothetical protein
MLAEVAASLGVPVVTGSTSMMERGRMPLDRDAVVAGNVPFVLHALRRLGRPAPVHTPYPTTLAPWLHRTVCRHDRLRTVLDQLRLEPRPIFIKPAKGWKRFTGFVTQDPDDPRFNGASRNAPVWTSEPIDILSEWRAYVVRGQVCAIAFADHGGDRHAVPDDMAIRMAVDALRRAGDPPAAFVIDFGVDRAGRTVLIEMNDGFSFGAYEGVDASLVWEVTVTRWFEAVTDEPDSEDIGAT